MDRLSKCYRRIAVLCWSWLLIGIFVSSEAGANDFEAGANDFEAGANDFEAGANDFEAGAKEANNTPTISAPRKVFADLADGIVQVRVLERVSGVKAGIGSGFHISAQGLVVTNYHVVSSYVWDQDRYSIDLVDAAGVAHPAELLFLDVVHDLALLQASTTTAVFVSVDPALPQKGDRVYAIGNPFDLGFTIVEGLYNGLVDNSRLERLNFAGSLNPGMSGGPAIDSQGKLVGVNVSTAGNQLSFFVPGSYVALLLKAYQERDQEKDANPIELVEQQLINDQQDKIGSLLLSPLATIKLGDYSVPSQIIPSLKCWSANEERKESRYSYVNHSCSTEDLIYVNPQLKVGNLYLFYTRLDNMGLNPFSFTALVQSSLQRYDSGSGGTKKDFTNYRCVQDFINQEPATIWINLCIRRYRKMPKLYDLSGVGATVDSETNSLLFYFDLAGVTIDNAQKFSQAFMEGMKWEGK